MARDTGHTPPLRAVAIAGVAVLAIVVGVLAVIAYQRANPPPTTEGAPAVPTFTLGVQTPTPTPTPEPEPEREFDRDTERFLAFGAGTLWRAVAGACDGAGPLVERSNDGGQSWDDVTPSTTGMRQVLSLDALAVDAVELLGGIADACAPQAFRSFTNGQFWADYPDVLAVSRYVDPTDPAVVHMAEGPVAAPCALAHGLRALRQTVALICDGTAYVWRGEQWTPLPGEDAVAVAITGTDVFSAHGAPDCAGLALTKFAGGDPAAPRPAGCAKVTDASAPVALVVDGSGLLVWSGDQLIGVE